MIRNYLQRLVLGLVLCLTMMSGTAEVLVTYYHADTLGSPQAASDENGHLLWTEHYRAYGERIENSATATANNNIWYTGKPQDSTTGLTYLNARYYDPLIGRFMAVDPVRFQEGNVQSFNRYAYANNNPYRYIDPDGRNAFATSYQDISPESKQFFLETVAPILFAGGVAAGAGEIASQITGIPYLSVRGILKKGFSKIVTKSGLGDLTKAEVKQIQKIVDEAGRPLDVIGSAAKGTRRNPGSNLPFGKDPATNKSDIDFITNPQHLPYFSGKQGKLPDIDPSTGIVPGAHNPFQGPGIRFEPGTKPVFTPGK